MKYLHFLPWNTPPKNLKMFQLKQQTFWCGCAASGPQGDCDTGTSCFHLLLWASAFCRALSHTITIARDFQSTLPPMARGKIKHLFFKHLKFQSWHNLILMSARLSEPILQCPWEHQSQTPIPPHSHHRSCSNPDKPGNQAVRPPWKHPPPSPPLLDNCCTCSQTLSSWIWSYS